MDKILAGFWGSRVVPEITTRTLGKNAFRVMVK